MRESREREIAAAASRGKCVVVTEDGIAWLSAGDPSWWYPATATRPKRPNVARIAADTGIPDKTLYPLIKGRPPENETLTTLLLFGASRRGVSVKYAFDRIVAVVERSAAAA